MKRTRLKPISEKRSAELKVYRTLRKEFLSVNRMCEAGVTLEAAGIVCGCRKWSSEIHHTAKRRKNLNNVDTWMPICRPCHDWIEQNKSKARELHLLLNINET